MKTDSKEENMKKIIDIIRSDLTNNVTNRIILLQNDTDTLMKRLKMRRRDGESAYTVESINQFRQHYQLLQRYLESDEKKIRFVDLGKFL